MDIKEITKPTVKATIKKLFEAKQDNYGKLRKGAYIIVDGQEYTASFKQNTFDFIKEGAEILGIRKVYKGNGYYEWHEGHDEMACVTTQPQNLEPTTLDPQSDKISRGAAYNLAFQWCLKHSDKAVLTSFLEEVEQIAEKIVPFQKTFVNK